MSMQTNCDRTHQLVRIAGLVPRLPYTCIGSQLTAHLNFTACHATSMMVELKRAKGANKKTKVDSTTRVSLRTAITFAQCMTANRNSVETES